MPLDHVVNRDDVWDNIKDAFVTGKGRIHERYGLIFGSLGMGKIMVVRSRWTK